MDSLILLRKVLSKKYSGGVVSLNEPLLCSAFRQDFEYAKSRHHSKKIHRVWSRVWGIVSKARVCEESQTRWF